MEEVTESKDELNQPDVEEEKEKSKEDKDKLHKNKVYSQFTPEIIECLWEVIKEVQKPLEDKLNTLIDVQNKQLEQDENIKVLNKN